MSESSIYREIAPLEICAMAANQKLSDKIQKWLHVWASLRSVPCTKHTFTRNPFPKNLAPSLVLVSVSLFLFVSPWTGLVFKRVSSRLNYSRTTNRDVEDSGETKKMMSSTWMKKQRWRHQATPRLWSSSYRHWSRSHRARVIELSLENDRWSTEMFSLDIGAWSDLAASWQWSSSHRVAVPWHGSSSHRAAPRIWYSSDRLVAFWHWSRCHRAVFWLWSSSHKSAVVTSSASRRSVPWHWSSSYPRVVSKQCSLSHRAAVSLHDIRIIG
jgi:hypothetical protein